MTAKRNDAKLQSESKRLKVDQSSLVDDLEELARAIKAFDPEPIHHLLDQRTYILLI